MSLSKIGAQALYAYSSHEALEICKTDDKSAISKFESYVSAKTRTSIVMHGTTRDANFFMSAVVHTNLTLLTYFIERMDVACLHARDSHGETAIFCLLHAKAPLQKIIACAEMLLNAGLDINARRSPTILNALKPLKNKLDLTQFQGDSVLGLCSSYLILSRYPDTTAIYNWTNDDIENLKNLIPLLITRGAECFVNQLGSIDWKDTSTAQDVSIDEKGISKAEYAILLRDIEIEIDWSKIRLLFSARLNNTSPISSILPELVLLISEKIFLLPLSYKNPG